MLEKARVERSAWHAWLRLDLRAHIAGYTAFQDGVSFGAEEYRDGLQFIYNRVCFQDPALQTDDRRVEVIISYV